MIKLIECNETKDFFASFLGVLSDEDKKKFEGYVWISVMNKHNTTKSPKVILMNVDQAYKECIVRVANSLDGVEIIHLDFSQYHANITSHKNISISLWFPYQWSPQIESLIKLIESTPRNNTVIHVGMKNKRRQHMFDMIENAGIEMIKLNATWGYSRDTKIASTKLLVNIHAYDIGRHNFEHFRCDPWILAGFPVISEESNIQDSLDIKDLVTFVKWRDMPNKINEILANYDTFIEEHKKKYDKIISSIVSGRKEKLQEICDLL